MHKFSKLTNDITGYGYKSQNISIQAKFKNRICNLPTFRWAAAFSLSVKTPVDSTMYSAPLPDHGISSGSLNILHYIHNNIIARSKNSLTEFHTNYTIFMRELYNIPDSKNRDGLVTKEKGVCVLQLHIVMLPAAVDGVVVEHVHLPHTKKKKKHSNHT